VFPQEMFSQEVGFISLHLSRLGVLVIGYSIGAIVMDALDLITAPRLIYFKPEANAIRRFIVSVDVYHAIANVTRPSKDTWEEDVCQQKEFALVGRGTEQPPPPTWSGIVFLGTSKGECFGVNWRNGEILSAEILPAPEPIHFMRHSNHRSFLQGSLSVNGKFMRNTDALRHLPTAGRTIGMAVSGALLFTLSVSGYMGIYRTKRNDFFPSS
jgi:hypothetical protein